MKLLLARHGNTFSPDMTPVFVGARDDMPLVDEGKRQAERFAEFLKANKTQIKAVYCGPLKRTREFAEIVVSTLKLAITPVIDQRLNELDYGDWSGRTNEEVVAKFGENALKGWNDSSIWPTGCGWGASPTEIADEVSSFVDDLLTNYGVEDTVLAVSSNGRLRYFLKLAPGLFEQRAERKSLKVAPGNACQLEFRDGVRLDYWNQSPFSLPMPGTQPA
jgi:broad specificity phosphatase PhoE